MHTNVLLLLSLLSFSVVLAASENQVRLAFLLSNNNSNDKLYFQGCTFTRGYLDPAPSDLLPRSTDAFTFVASSSSGQIECLYITKTVLRQTKHEVRITAFYDSSGFKNHYCWFNKAGSGNKTRCPSELEASSWLKVKVSTQS
ncbi:hypothetical protein P9112_004633 [Eukaryota sp. TZLM1-RC]